MYEVTCEDYNHSHVGQFNQHISQHIREHQLAVVKGVKSTALAQHAALVGHNINLVDIKILAATESLKHRIIREAIEIEVS